jgi:hypothetical protein
LKFYLAEAVRSDSNKNSEPLLHKNVALFYYTNGRREVRNDLIQKKRENSVGNRIWNGNNHGWETEEKNNRKTQEQKA